MNSSESFDPQPQLASRFARGVFWTGGSSVITSLVRLLILAVLARLLTPRDFGLFSLSLLVVDFGNDVGDFGIGPAIIQHRQVTRPLLNTVFWLALFGNIALFLGAIMVAPLLAWFFKENTLFVLIVVSSISFPIRSAGFVQRALMQKELLFSRIAAVEVFSTVVFGTVAIALAYLQFGIWSLIYGVLAHRLTDVILLWCLSNYRPAVQFRREECKFIYHFAKNVTGERIAYFFSSRMDYIIVGRLLGSAMLGYYTLASEITSTPQKRISAIVSSVAVPTFSLFQDHVAALRNAYIKVNKTLSLITFPLLVGLVSLAPEFVNVFYGQKWAPIVVPIQILCVAGAIKSIMHNNGAILYARLRPDIAFRWALLQLVTIPFPLIVGASHGIVGIAITLAVAFVLYFAYMQNVINAQIDMRFAQYLRGFLPMALGSLCLGGICILTKAILAATLNPGNGITLIIAGTVGGFLYLALIRLVDRISWDEIASLARKVVPAKAQL
jgi:O-antigen/teichoic acid export membrane protein